ncbi:hypothetical protein Dimus_008280 [Dionaea muscipula]
MHEDGSSPLELLVVFHPMLGYGSAPLLGFCTQRGLSSASLCTGWAKIGHPWLSFYAWPCMEFAWKRGARHSSCMIMLSSALWEGGGSSATCSPSACCCCLLDLGKKRGSYVLIMEMGLAVGVRR